MKLRQQITLPQAEQAAFSLSALIILLAVWVYTGTPLFDSLFIAAGLSGLFLIFYRIVRGILDPAWLNTQAPGQTDSDGYPEELKDADYDDAD